MTKRKHAARVTEIVEVFPRHPTPQSVRDDLKKAQTASKVPTLEVEECNPLYPAMSTAVSFKYKAGRGRYAVATRDIKVGLT